MIGPVCGWFRSASAVGKRAEDEEHVSRLRDGWGDLLECRRDGGDGQSSEVREPCPGHRYRLRLNSTR